LATFALDKLRCLRDRSWLCLLRRWWLRPANIREAAWVGFVWLVLTLTFEIAFGRFVVHASWARIASDYDLPRGGLLPIGLFVLAGAPLIAAKLRRVL